MSSFQAILKMTKTFEFCRKKILEILSKTTLFVMMDDPLISTNLGEFLNQIQGGLLQGSAASGMFAPRGSILLTSNDEEVKRCATFNVAVTLINATVQILTANYIIIRH